MKLLSNIINLLSKRINSKHKTNNLFIKKPMGYFSITNSYEEIINRDKNDYAAEVYLKNGKIPLPLSESDYDVCPIDKWYNPDCIPAIISDVFFDKKIKVDFMASDGSHIILDSNVLTVLFCEDQYIILPSGILAPNCVLNKIKKHFHSRGVSKVIDGKELKFGVDKAHGQSKTVTTSTRASRRRNNTSKRSGKNNPSYVKWVNNFGSIKGILEEAQKTESYYVEIGKQIKKYTS